MEGDTLEVAVKEAESVGRREGEAVALAGALGEREKEEERVRVKERAVKVGKGPLALALALGVAGADVARAVARDDGGSAGGVRGGGADFFE